MATWVERSFALVEGGGYLDRLADIYPIPTPTRRPLNDGNYILDYPPKVCYTHR